MNQTHIDQALTLASRGYVRTGHRQQNVQLIPLEVRTLLRELAVACKGYRDLLADRERDLAQAYRDQDAMAREALEAERDRDG